MSKEKIVFIYPKIASFIQLDIDLLSEKYFLVQNTYNWTNKIAIPLILLRQLFFLLKHIRSSKVLLVSFGGYWSLLPSLLGYLFNKPIYIILHGTDCASFPEINYGNLSKPILKYILKISYHFATKLLPVSKSLIYTENTYFSQDKVIKQGYKHFFKNNETENTIIHNGIDTCKWDLFPGNNRNETKFITVLSEGQFVRKGGEIIIAVANKLPQFEFHFIGIEKPSNLGNLSPNVHFIKRLAPAELLKVYNNSKYYLQLSIFEGFGCALCEAMSCGCIPIVANVNILADIIGETGYVLKKHDPESLFRLINEITTKVNKVDKEFNPRKRIIENFSIAKRQHALFNVIDHQ